MIPDILEEKFNELKIDVSTRVNRVGQEIQDVTKVIKEVGNQIGDIPKAATGRTRPGRNQRNNGRFEIYGISLTALGSTFSAI